MIQRGVGVFCMGGWGGRRIQSIGEIFRNTEEGTGAPEEQAAAYQHECSTQEDTVKYANEQRNLGTPAYSIKRKWENQANKVYKQRT